MATLKAGDMGSASASGQPPEFAGSMAAEIEQALNRLLTNDGVDPFPVNDNSRETRDRRRLFVAIAQGVVQHLKDRELAFEITNSGGTPTGARVDLQTS